LFTREGTAGPKNSKLYTSASHIGSFPHRKLLELAPFKKEETRVHQIETLVVNSKCRTKLGKSANPLGA